MVDNPADKQRPKNFFEILWSDKVALFLLVFVIGFFFYLAYLNRDVPNTEYFTHVDPYTNVSVTTSAVRYPLDAPKVPYQPITQGHAFIGAVAVFIFAYYVLMKMLLGRYLITSREAWEKIVEKEVRYMARSNYPEFSHPDSVAVSGFHLQHYQFGDDGERKPFAWVLCFRLEKDDIEKFYVAKVQPYTYYILDLLEAEKPMVREDTCARCGSTYYKDVHVKLPSDIGRMYQTMRGAYSQRRP